MEYTLIRSDRRTVCIQLTAAGEIVVRAPKRARKADIDAFVNSKAGWIASHQAQILARNAARDAFRLHDGDAVPICGRPFAVRLQEGAAPRISGGGLILPCGEMDAVRGDILRLARETAQPWIGNRLGDWAEKMDAAFSGWKYSTARQRWGSCSRDGVIRISVYLLFAPERAAEYVLVHELAHLRQFDHSPAFWEIVAEAMPDYREQKRALRAFQDTPLVQSLAGR